MELSSVEEIVEEMMRIHRSLPARPELDEVEAAKALISNAEREEQARLEAISRQKKKKKKNDPNVPEELFAILQEMQRSAVHLQSKEQTREAIKLLDLENAHLAFDVLIQRASNCVNSNNSSDYSKPNKVYEETVAETITLVTETVTETETSSSSSLLKKEPAQGTGLLFTRDDSYVNKARSAFGAVIVDSSLKPVITASGQDDGGGDNKLSLIKLASLIEVSAKKGTRDLKLQNKLMDQVDWLPDSLGKLSSLVSLDLSENRITMLPPTIGGLSLLTRLDLHSNRIAELPDSVGDLLSLVYLNLGGNQLSSLPDSFGKLVGLEELDLSSNQLSALPKSIGSLVSLQVLNVETNDIEEIPHSISHCSSLRELRADYNRLKALPEAVGKIQGLEILSVRYNNIRQLPTTMSALTNLKELNVSFNELESVPESLCFATSLVKMNIGNNFADMQFLPRSIGNLEMLEELDISNNQIRFLPDSFRMLTRLRVLKVEENPLEFPPRHIAENGAQAVVKYMAELVEKRDVRSQPLKQKKSWALICFFPKSNKRRRGGVDLLNA